MRACVCAFVCACVRDCEKMFLLEKSLWGSDNTVVVAADVAVVAVVLNERATHIVCLLPASAASERWEIMYFFCVLAA